MYRELLKLKYIPVKNCYVYLSPSTFSKLVGTLMCGIKLTRAGNEHFYFSAHDSPSQMVEHGEIGLSATYAKLLHLLENDCVTIAPFHNIGSITRIHACPFTSDDLEILEGNSDAVESTLLSQLRIVWPKQVFPVWISPSVIVTLIVDSLSPDLKFGRLEEYSEVVIQDVKRTNHVKSDVNYSTPIKSKKSTKVKKSSEIFRCVPLEKSQSNHAIDPLNFKIQPYDVFVNKGSTPSWLVSLITKTQPSLWVLSKLDFDVDEESKDKQKTNKTTNNSTNSIESHEIVVSVHLNDELNTKDIGLFQSLYVSSTIRKFLNLRPGSKVSLRHIEKERGSDIVSLLVTPLFDWQNDVDVKEIESELSQTLLNTAMNCGYVVINNNAPYLLNENQYVMLTIRPLSMQWGLLKLSGIQNLSIHLNTLKSDRLNTFPIESDISEETKIIVPSFEELICQGFLTIDTSLGLNSGIQHQVCDGFVDNIIVVGKRGSGKTELVDQLLQKACGEPYHIYALKTDCKILKGKRVETVSKLLSDSLKRCEELQPSILVLENVSSIAGVPKPDQEKSESSLHITRISYKIMELVESYQRNNSILVIGTADSIESVNPKLFSPRGKSLFSTLISVPDLNKNDRCELLKHMVCEKAPDTKKLISELDLELYSSQTDGYVLQDLIQLVQKALFEAWQRKAQIGGPLAVISSDMHNALKANVPFALQGLNLNEGQKYTFDNVGGLKEVKEKLIQVILWPLQYPEIMDQCPLKQQNAVLLYGVPGSGKTLVANCLAGESSLNFISIKGPELMSKYIGESEEGIRKVFEKAQAAKPCLLFFDEFDSLAPRRGKDQTGVTDRVVNQLLTALDGVESITGVWVIAATSRPDLIDPALLRPGRIGTSVLCELPSEADRLEILQKLCSNLSLAGDVELEEIAKRTELFSGADLKGLITTAQIKLVDSLIELPSSDASEQYSLRTPENDQIILTQKLLLEALKETKPSMNKKELVKYKIVYNEFQSGKIQDVSAQKVTFA